MSTFEKNVALSGLTVATTRCGKARYGLLPAPRKGASDSPIVYTAPIGFYSPGRQWTDSRTARCVVRRFDDSFCEKRRRSAVTPLIAARTPMGDQCPNLIVRTDRGWASRTSKRRVNGLPTQQLAHIVPTSIQ